MLEKLRPRSIYDVMAAIACFVALAGGTAYAANTITTGDIVDNQVTSADVRDDTLGFGGLAAQDLGPGSVGSSEVKDGSLGTVDIGELHGSRLVPGSVRGTAIGTSTITGNNVAANTLDSYNINEATLFRCPGAGSLVGHLCVYAPGTSGSLGDAFNACGAAGLRVPSWGEAYLLGRNFDVPGVSGSQRFWTDEITDWTDFGSLPVVMAVDENGNASSEGGSGYANQIVCVETPTGLP